MVWESGEGVEGGGGDVVNVCQGLDWKRVFGLHMWYCSSHTARIAESLAQYTIAFSVSSLYDIHVVYVIGVLFSTLLG